MRNSIIFYILLLVLSNLMSITIEIKLLICFSNICFFSFNSKIFVLNWFFIQLLILILDNMFSNYLMQELKQFTIRKDVLT